MGNSDKATDHFFQIFAIVVKDTNTKFTILTILSVQFSAIVYINTIVQISPFIYKSLFILCCCSVGKLYPTFCDPRDGSMLGSSVFHCLPKSAQISVH